MAGQSSSRSSSWVTNRPACSTRYRSTPKALGVSATRASPCQRHWFAVSSRKDRNRLIADALGYLVLHRAGGPTVGPTEQIIQPPTGVPAIDFQVTPAGRGT